MRFTKMQAFGNDYVYIDAVNQQVDELPQLARFISDRHHGVGSDGMVLICPSDKADFRMRIFNPDGTEAEMCGNAIRSVGKYVYDHGMTGQTKLTIETIGGVKQLELYIENGMATNIRANIGVPLMGSERVPVNTEGEEFVNQPVNVLGETLYVTAVSWGNPHCVAFVGDVASFDVFKYGRALEHKRDLFPNRTNVTFAQVVDRSNVKIREWERGTGETMGCGTGCCTAVVAGVRMGLCDRKVAVEQIGGVLMVEWDQATGEMYMTGPSHTVFEAELCVKV